MTHFHPHQKEIYDLFSLLDNGVAYSEDMGGIGTRSHEVAKLIVEAIKAYYKENPRVPGLVNDLIKQHLLMRFDDVFYTINRVVEIVKIVGEDGEKVLTALEKEGLAIRIKPRGQN